MGTSPAIGGVLMADFRARRLAIVVQGTEAGKICSRVNRLAYRQNLIHAHQKNIVPLQKSANNKP
jgi:hypothetical protein